MSAYDGYDGVRRVGEWREAQKADYERSQGLDMPENRKFNTNDKVLAIRDDEVMCGIVTDVRRPAIKGGMIKYTVIKCPDRSLDVFDEDQLTLFKSTAEQVSLVKDLNVPMKFVEKKTGPLLKRKRRLFQGLVVKD